MRALFEIRGKMLVAETDATLPPDTVRVHSLDSFAKILESMDPDQTEQFIVAGKNGSEAPVKRRNYAVERERARRRIAAATAIQPDAPSDICPPAPETGWRDASGHKIILGNFGVSREQIALAMRDNTGKLTEDEVKLLSLRFGIGNPKAKAHSTTEVANVFSFGPHTSGQAAVSSAVKHALRRLGLRPKTIRHRKGGAK